MFRNLRELFTGLANDPVSAGEDRLHVAAAVLMLEVAKADQQLDAVELARIAMTLSRQWGLVEQDLADLLETAGAESDTHASLHHYLDLLNTGLDAMAKTALVRGLWEVAWADGEIHHHEEHLIRRLADLLYVPHRDFIRTKHAAMKGD